MVQYSLLFLVHRTSKTNTLCTAFGPSNLLILDAYETEGILGSPTQRLLEIQFRARRNYLETFLPMVDSRIVSPGGWGQASWVVRRIRPVEWRGRAEITVVGLSIFNALLSTAEKELKEFNPVILCDNADFVIAAREELNLPILLADLKESVIGSRYLLKLERSSHSFMEIHANLASCLGNGVSAKPVIGESWVSVAPFKREVLDAVLPGLANVIERLQGLDMKDPVITRSNIIL